MEPNKNLEIPDAPFVPIMIKSQFDFFATALISSTAKPVFNTISNLSSFGSIANSLKS